MALTGGSSPLTVQLSTLTIFEWTHVALVVTLGSLRVYRDGLLAVSQILPGNRLIVVNETLYFGGDSLAAKCVVSQFTFFDYDIGACGVDKDMGAFWFRGWRLVFRCANQIVGILLQTASMRNKP